MLTTLNTSTGSESGEFGYTVFGREVAEQLRDDTNQVRSDADARFLRYGLLATAAVLLALATTWLVSQSLTRPLRSLTRQAKTMASDRLPNAVRSILNTPLGEDVEVPEMAPVRVKTRDEVGDVQRVTVLGVEPAMVVGSAAADLAHLCAEFVENALTFSPPDQNVEVRGRHRPDGYTLAIIDNGFGMAPEDIERANRRLAGSESFTIAPWSYLGYYEAGTLGPRHDVTVRLEPSPGSGVTAMIHLPPSLLAADATPAASAMPGVVGGGSASLPRALPP